MGCISKREYSNIKEIQFEETVNREGLFEDNIFENEDEFDEEFFSLNDFEANVVSNSVSSNIFENQFLKEFNLIVNTKFNILICKTCKYVVEVDSVFNHLSRNHRRIINSKILNDEKKQNFIAVMNLTFPNLNSNFDFSCEGGDEIEGIKLNVGFHCSHNQCEYLCVEKNSLYKHSKESHGCLPMFIKCNIQTLFCNPEKKKYFKVIANNQFQNNEVNINEENDAIFGMRQSGIRNYEMGHKFISSFETESNWAIIESKFTDEEIQEIISIEIPVGLTNSINLIYNKGENHSKNCNHHFVEKLNNPFSKYII